MRKTKLTYSNEAELEFICKGVEQSLMSGKYKFTRTRTTGTAKYQTKKEQILVLPGTNELAGASARFVGSIKKHFKSSKLPERISDERPFYEYFVPISTYTELTDVCEVDINGAYWESAYELGYITKDLYKSAESVSKKARLIALGVLGKKTAVSVFEPPYSEIETTEHYERERVFWDNIVWNLGETIRDVTSRYKPHIFGIWFDAIFCTKSSANNIRRYLQRRGYETKIKQTRSYVITPRDGIAEGAKIERIFMDGTRKEMDVTYTRKKTMDQFLESIK